MSITDNNTTALDYMISLIVKRPLLSLGVGCVMIASLGIGPSFLGITIGANKQHEESEYKNNIVHRLLPFVEKSDGELGISLKDKIDFAERGGIPTYNIIEGNNFDLYDYSFSVLEKALMSYEADRFKKKNKENYLK